MTQPLILHPDRLLPADPATRAIARELYVSIAALPIVSPHGHTDPSWFALNEPFGDATDLLLRPDHYVFRMLYSQGIAMESLPIRARRGGCSPATGICSAGRRPACGSTGFLPPLLTSVSC
jgi:glucuronate isomerase